MAVLTDYRSDLDNLLAAAVDSSTWTTAIKDTALRQALLEYNELTVYESSFSVSSSGEEQDLSSISGLNRVLSLAWPWSDGEAYDHRLARWRSISGQTVYIEDGEPRINDLIRVRYTKVHTIQDLDSAAATTVPDRHRLFIGLLASAWACDLRIRQLTENPAIPKEAIRHLTDLAAKVRAEASRRFHTLQTLPGPGPSWSVVGL